MTADPILVAETFAQILEGLGVPYLVGGSVASTLFGEPRATLAVDFVTHLESAHLPSLQEALAADWYLDLEGARHATLEGGSFNAIHLPSMVKVDVYVRPRSGLFAEELRRATPQRLSPDSDRSVRVATPEDTVLQKLRWYEAGDRVSDRQWRDVLGVLKSVGPRLDRAYMEHWARELGLEELLALALRQGGIGTPPSNSR